MGKEKKPLVFIASASESLEIAELIQLKLKYDAKCVIWTDLIFDNKERPLDSLLKNIDKFDFSVFIFSSDDGIIIRQKSFKCTRDNVIFEAGLFMSKMGLDRTFILVDKQAKDFHFPTDLYGFSPIDYEYNSGDEFDSSDLGPACTEIKRGIKRLGFRESKSSTVERVKSNNSDSIQDTMNESGNFSSDFFDPRNWETQGDWHFFGDYLTLTKSNFGGIYNKMQPTKHYTFRFNAKKMHHALGIIIRAEDMNKYYMFQANLNDSNLRLVMRDSEIYSGNLGFGPDIIKPIEYNWTHNDINKFEIITKDNSVTFKANDRVLITYRSLTKIDSGKVGFRCCGPESANISKIELIPNEGKLTMGNVYD